MGDLKVSGYAASLLFAAMAVAQAEQESEWAATQALYDARCAECHGEGAHLRDHRAARTYDEIRNQVRLWDTLAPGTAWTPQEIEQVTAYLNQRFYRYPQR